MIMHKAAALCGAFPAAVLRFPLRVCFYIPLAVKIEIRPVPAGRSSRYAPLGPVKGELGRRSGPLPSSSAEELGRCCAARAYSFLARIMCIYAACAACAAGDGAELPPIGPGLRAS